eukprot:scaffold1596_cov302-Pinguiococcus_pyrenoidosus.AAC.64
MDVRLPREILGTPSACPHANAVLTTRASGLSQRPGGRVSRRGEAAPSMGLHAHPAGDAADPPLSHGAPLGASWGWRSRKTLETAQKYGKLVRISAKC